MNTPHVIKTAFRSIDLTSSKLVWEVMEKEEYLPLRIDDSTIVGAGKGMFATKNIPEKTLIHVYTGDIGVHYDVRKSDSIFDMGVLKYR